ncbi:MAG: NADPH:quinone oxidoreductase family protein [Sphingopyxis sp.]
MRALQVHELAPDYAGVRLDMVSRPEPGPGAVSVAVDAASLNFPDLLLTRGEYQMKPEPPFTIGGDLAGTVDAIGPGVEGLAPGDRVWGIGLGCFADWAILPATSVGHLPSALSMAEGAAFGAAYLTAYVALVERGGLRPGEWVVINGASGGMGLAAVDLAKALGAHVIAVSASADKRARIAELYAPDHILAPGEDLAARVKALTGGGADLVFDPVNGDAFDQGISALAFGGRMLVIGFTSGEKRSLRSNVALIKSIALIGVRAGEYGRRYPERRKAIASQLENLVAAGKIRPHVDSIYAIEQWAKAFERMETRGAVGKIVLSIGGET